jgi:hypothetical protein
MPAEPERFNNETLAWKICMEGLDYTVRHLFNVEDCADEDVRQAAIAARDANNNLVAVLERKLGVEEDEWESSVDPA